MRHHIKFSVVAAALVALAAPAVVSADPPTAEQIRDIEVIELSCEVRAAGDRIASHCRWEAPSSPRAAAVKLFRFDPDVDPHRQVVYRSSNVSITWFTDRHVRPGHRYAYGVVVYDDRGRRVAQSRPEWVRVPAVHEVEPLKLACALGDVGEAIGCEWSRPQTRDAFVVTLWRSVNDGPREVVERFRPTGPTTYRDRVPTGATEVTYVVIATSEDDRIVARSRSDVVRVPQVDTRPVDTRPVDTRPVDTRSVDTRPVDTRPVDTRPVDTRPVDTRPVDTRPVDTRPVDTRPVDTRPVDTRPVDTRPVDVAKERTAP